MLGGLVYRLGNNLLATPARLVVGFIFISQGVMNMNSEAASSSDLMFNINQYGIEGFTHGAFSVLLIIAGACAVLGIFVRLIGLAMAFIIITNLFAGLADVAVVNFTDTVKVLQDRLILAIGSLTLFFLGGGFFCLDNIIFRGVGSALSGDDEQQKKSPPKMGA